MLPLPPGEQMRYNIRTNLVCFGRIDGGEESMARSARRVKPRFWLILMVLMLSVYIVLTSSQRDLIEQQAAVIDELTLTKETMEVEIASAQRRLEFSKSDDYIERIARSELGLVMPDEVLYVQSNND